MSNIWLRIIVSVILAIMIGNVFLYVTLLIYNTGQLVADAMGVASIATMIFCTFTIIEEIKKNKNH
ncbi:hypothetical protein IAI10_13865 [Clostridium sp. 19966]|uniref:hypothetical protein n=1 Tax=Clostridium sp. 19966 TaxID=2768166 RepID=UPI0028DF3907|nr:hypothetical protein [Clostridium sp. 19966]MDT8717751.1 hypothetical protein [Clostridium sp. 19966]